jgi:hypothetical protein
MHHFPEGDPAMKTKTFLALAATAWILTSDSTQAKESGLCTQTSQAGRRACENDVRDDLWTEVAICTNGSDAAGRKTCKQAAKQAEREARQECGDIFDAREELCDAIGQDAYAPDLSPSRFVSPAAAAANPNPFLRLVPGSVRVYDGDGEHVTVTVTNRTKLIGGVMCTVVVDTVLNTGSTLVEDTEDYFAQDVDGNVWYFGELVKNYENGELVDLDGSFLSGTNGAKAGMAMKAAPVVGETYRQEFAFGEAEDAGKVMSITGTATVPGTSCAGTCLITEDFTPIEPGHVENKYFKSGIGEILSVDTETGARLELTSFTNP